MALKPQYTLATVKPPAGMKTHPIPLKLNPSKVKLNLSPAAKTYLTARAAVHSTTNPGASALAASQRLGQTALKGGIFARPAGGGGAKVAQTPQEMIMSVVSDYMNKTMSSQDELAMYQKGIQAQIAAQAAAARGASADQVRAIREASAEQIRAAKAATAQERYQDLQQQNRASGFALALGSLERQQGQQTYSDYERAAQNIQGLGTGLTGAVEQTQQAAADKAAADIAQASGGVNTAGSTYDLPGLRSTAQYTGVVTPSRDLYGEAANQAAAAQVRAAAGAQHVSNIAADYGQKALTAQHALTGQLGTLQGNLATSLKGQAGNLTSALRTIQATRPDLYQKAIEAVQTGSRQDVATLISALTLMNTQQMTAANIAQTGAETAATTTKVSGFQYDPKTGEIKKDKAGNPLLATNFWLPPGTVTPQPIPSDQHVSKDGTRLVPNAKSSSPADTAAANNAATKAKQDANVKAGYTPDGKDVGPGFYYGPGGKPAKIPTGWMLDPNDPTKTKIVKNPQAGGRGGRGGSGGWTPSTIQSAINSITLPAPDAPGAYATITNAPLVKAGQAPIYKPKFSLKVATARLRSKYPKAIQNDPRVTTAIQDALATIGYKV